VQQNAAHGIHGELNMKSETNNAIAPNWSYGDLIENDDGGFSLAGAPTPIDVNSLSIRDQAILEALEEQMEATTDACSIRQKRVKAIMRRKKSEMRKRGEKVKEDTGQKMENRPFLYRKGDKYILLAQPTEREWYSVTPAGTGSDGTPVYSHPVHVDVDSLSLEARTAMRVFDEELAKAEKKLAALGLDPDGAFDTLDMDMPEAKAQERIRRARQVN
jgi:hypothetical protein